MTGIACGLDFGAIMAVGAALDADLELLADTLPDFEVALLGCLNADSGGDEGDPGVEDHHD